jgi:hypothetical protein
MIIRHLKMDDRQFLFLLGKIPLFSYNISLEYFMYHERRIDVYDPYGTGTKR